MIIVQLKGGLGNQMFQYAFGKYLASINNTTLVLDTSFLQSKLPFKKWATPMQYELHIFNIRASLKSNIISSNFVLYPFAKAEHWIRTKWYENNYNSVSEPVSGFDAEILKTKDNSYIKGNYQSEIYFQSIEKELRSDFVFVQKLDNMNAEWQAQILNCNAVSLHVRRGDYISIKRNAQKFASLSQDYYQTAIKRMSDKISNPVFFIFSDDINWAKNNLEFSSPVFFVTNNNNPSSSYIDMQLMSLCKHNIIANSTFSWWAAWLNNNQEKMVIAPDKWYVDKSVNSPDIIPNSWIKL